MNKRYDEGGANGPVLRRGDFTVCRAAMACRTLRRTVEVDTSQTAWAGVRLVYHDSLRWTTEQDPNGQTDLAAWLTVWAAAIYTVGWSYTYGYYTTFGLSARTVGLSFYDTMLESVRVLQQEIWWTVILVLCTAGLLWWASRTAWLRDGPRSVRLGTLGVLALLLIPGIFWRCSAMGHADAVSHMQEASPALPTVTLDLNLEKAPTNLFDPDEITGGRVVDAGYRLLASTEKTYFLIRPMRAPAKADLKGIPPQALVLEVPRDALRGLRYQAAQR